MVTVELSVVTTLPKASSTSTETAGLMNCPGTTEVGWVAKTSCAGEPTAEVAVNVIGPPKVPGAVATRVFVPGVGPRTQEPTVAMPAGSVTTVAGASDPP